MEHTTDAQGGTRQVGENTPSPNTLNLNDIKKGSHIYLSWAKNTTKTSVANVIN